MKSINIKGKQYVTVSERVLFFNEAYPNGKIETALTYNDELGIVRAMTKVTPDTEKPDRYFTGHSEENRQSSMINKTSATENCETSAVGRALGLMGIGIIEGIASADEMNKAIAGQKVLDDSAPRKVCVDCGQEYNPKVGTEAFSTKCYACYKKNGNKKTIQDLPVIEQELNEPPF
jgi:hypothetical protein